MAEIWLGMDSDLARSLLGIGSSLLQIILGVGFELVRGWLKTASFFKLAWCLLARRRLLVGSELALK